MLSKFQCFNSSSVSKVSKFQSFKVSKVSIVSKFQSFKSFNVSKVQCFNIHDGSVFGEHGMAQKCSYVIQWYTAIYSIMIRIVCIYHLNCYIPRWILIVNVI